MNSPDQGMQKQIGASLLVVLAILMLASLVMIGGLSLLNQGQRIATNEVDRIRVFQVAQALLSDAERDVMNPSGRTASDIYFPLRLGEYDTTRLRIAAKTGLNCAQGICTPQDLDTLASQHWMQLKTTDVFWATGARYGEFTGATDTSGAALLDQARYWVEVMVANLNNASQGMYVDSVTPFVFRITAVAFGKREGTQVVLQTLYVLTQRP